MPLHLYGVVDARAPLPEMPGVGDPPGRLRLVAADDLAAVVSEIAEDAALAEADAVTHLDVLSATVARTAVLPLRFGTSAPDDASVRDEVLAPAAADLRHRLDALADQVELRVELGFDEEPALRSALADRPELRSASRHDLESRLWLGEQVADELATWTREQGERLMAEPVSLATRAARSQGTTPLTDQWSLLVARDRVPAVDTAVSRLRADPSVEVEYVGPLPAYSFLEQIPEPAAATHRWGW